jgi:FKBP-type peptidyl-prolyl cis-trans isomerase
MSPPGSNVDPLTIDVTDEAFKAKAIGEVATTSTPTGGEETNSSAVDMDAPIIEPTAPGEEFEADSGLRVTTLEPGDPDGQVARVGNTVEIFYTGMLADGTIFDSNVGKAPLVFQVGPGSGLIQGWNEGVPGMRVGEKRKLVIPSELAYGKEGRRPKIPPDAELTFELELSGVR